MLSNSNNKLSKVEIPVLSVIEYCSSPVQLLNTDKANTLAGKPEQKAVITDLCIENYRTLN